MEPLAERNDPACSLEVEFTDGSGKSLSFPTLNDYINWYVAKGIVRDRDDLLVNHVHLISEILFDWIKRGQLGCFFAMLLARGASSTDFAEKSRVQWESIVISNPFDQSDLVGQLNETLDNASKVADAVQFIFPTINTERDIVQLVNSLCQNRRWYWTEIPWKNGEAQRRLIGLRWILPDGLHVNHVLGFASIEAMPITRRSPFTAIVIRVAKKKREPKRKFEDDRLVVHLADIDSGLGSQSRHDRMTHATKAYKRQLLQSEILPSTRAMVTFQLDFENSAGLCEPRAVEIVESDAG